MFFYFLFQKSFFYLISVLEVFFMTDVNDL